MTESVADAVARASSFPYHTSGSPRLDRLLGGGFRAGRLVEVFGKSNSGKSQVGAQAALFAASKGERVLYIDTEGAFRPERLEQIADSRGMKAEGALERIIYVRCDSASQQMETVRGMAKRKETSACALVVVDTLTRNFTVELPGDANLQSRQGALGVHMSEMARDAYIGGRAYVLTNRVTFGAPKDVGIGGKTVEQMVGASVGLERDGQKVRATLLGSGESVELEIGVRGLE